MNTLRHFAAVTALLTAALGATSNAQAAGGLVITPASTTVNPGDSFDVLVRGSSFSDNVVGGGFNLAFDPAVLSLTGVSVDTGVWEFVSSTGTVDNLLGTLADVYFNSFRPVLPTGDFAVATLQFTAKAVGSSMLQLGASPSFPFSNDLADTIAVDFGAGSVQVTAVPEPQAWALLLAGLGVIGQLTRRRSQGTGSGPTLSAGH